MVKPKRQNLNQNVKAKFGVVILA